MSLAYMHIASALDMATHSLPWAAVLALYLCLCTMAKEPMEGRANQRLRIKKTDHVYHTTTDSRATASIQRGIERRYLNPESRFGRAFYVAEVPGTTLAELKAHGFDGVDTMRFRYNRESAKELDLTDPETAASWNYAGGPITEDTQAIGEKASTQGFNVIRFGSLRGRGDNLASLSDFNSLLTYVD